MKRRIFLKGSLATGAIGMAISAGLLTPRMALAAWPKAAFDATSVDSAVSNLFGSSTLTGSDKITIKAPDIAENGAVVPISVETDIEGVESISIIAEKNATPLTASFTLGKVRSHTSPPASSWVKPAVSSPWSRRAESSTAPARRSRSRSADAGVETRLPTQYHINHMAY
jgi:sulfur-oxidizing protein SoxY